MKSPILIFLLLFFAAYAFPQSKKDLAAQINLLSVKIDAVNSKFELLSEQNKSLNKDITSLNLKLSDSEREIQSLKSQLNQGNSLQEKPSQPSSEKNLQNPSKRCKAITSAGSQCSRNADEGSEYCWQHKKTYEPDKPSKSTSGSNGSSNYNGKEIQTGPRGGQYYINSKGNKTYIKK